MPAQQRYREGKVLTWMKLDGGDTPTQRRVAFQRYLAGSGQAVVAYGFTAEGNPVSYTANLAELSRPQPAPPHPPFHPGRVEPPKPPKPLTEVQIDDRLTQRREALGLAFDKTKAARDAVAYAKELVDRARKEFEQARSALLVLDQHHRADQQNLEEAIRTGQPTPDPTRNGRDRSYIVSQVHLTETALKKFERESAAANATLNDALAAVRKTALQVVAALADRECEALRQSEERVLQRRAELLAVASWWPDAATGPIPLSRAAAAALEAPPDYERCRFLSSREEATAPYKELLDRLVQGDARADFKLEK